MKWQAVEAFLIPSRWKRTFGLIAALAMLSLAFGQNAAAPTVEDLEILHESTVPANRGERVRLFVRHYQGNGAMGTIVAVSPDPLSVVPALGLDANGLDHLALLAERGFDVFAADVTGYGLSPRPRMSDACNTPWDVQNELLIPHPLYIVCEGGYSRLLTSLFTDRDDIAAIVDHVLERTGDDRVTLLGWGLGAARVAAYAADFPETVASLVLVAPPYDATVPSEEPSPYPDGFPLEVHDVNELVDTWRSASTCEGFGAFDEVAAALPALANEFDPVAADWGLIPGDLFRSPGHLGLAGWNRDVAQRIQAPTLMVTGLKDPSAGEAQALFEDLGGTRTLRLDVECGTHWLLWEGSRDAVREAIAEFVASGTVAGREEGVILLERDGSLP